MPLTRHLDPVEQRVLGALMEKERTTPDVYPLSVNALVGACNQRSNRDPVTSYGEEAVRDALERLRRDVLVWRSDGARVQKWEHRLRSRWNLDDASQAVMTLLLLRGPQTPGELRSRCERLHPFATVAEVEAVLERLAAGPDALVCELERQPGQRESRWAHTMGTEPVSGRADEPRRHGAAEPPIRAVPAAEPAAPGLDERVAALEERLAVIERRLADLLE